MAACQERTASAEREFLILSEMVVAREREAAALRGQLDEAHARHDRSLRSLEVLAGHLDELHAQARGQATRIRMKALDEAVQVTERAGHALGTIRGIEQMVNEHAPPAQPQTNGAEPHPPSASPQPNLSLIHI